MMWLSRILIAGILATLLAVLHIYSPLQLTSVVPYAGLILVITGLICVIRPLKTVFVRSRKAAACLIAVGFFAAGLQV
jgi:tryptophan-rich sensory protein